MAKVKKKRIVKKVLPIVFVLITFCCFFWFYQNLQIGKNTQAIFIQDPSLDKEITLKIALIGDIHISDTEKEYEKIKYILEKIEMESPDLILFAGDYTSLPSSVSDMENHRFKIAKLLTKESNKKKVFILGNYESWSRPEAWVNAFKGENAIVLENEIRKVEIDGQTICIRGLGDYYTNRFKYIDYPKDCVRSGKITITHDPAGAFHNNVQGLVLAAHTHCGQIRLPFIGALWIPSAAPIEATCGLYQDLQRTVFTTAGAGTTILPLRIGTKSTWDLLTLTFFAKEN